MALHASVFEASPHTGFPPPLIPLIETLNPKLVIDHGNSMRTSQNFCVQPNVEPLHGNDDHSATLKKKLGQENKVSQHFSSEDRHICELHAKTDDDENARQENIPEISLHVDISMDERSDVQIPMENEPVIWVPLENLIKNESNFRVSTENGLAHPACAPSDVEGIECTLTSLSDNCIETLRKPTKCINDEPMVNSSEARKPGKLTNVSFEPELFLDSGGVSFRDDSNMTIELQLESNVGLDNVGNILVDGESVEPDTSIKDQLMRDNVINVPQTSECPWSLIQHKDMEVKAGKENGEDLVEDKAARNDTQVEGTLFKEDKKQVGNAEKEQNLIGRTIRKRFGRKYFIGTIDSYDRENSWYKVLYQDGDQEDLEEAEAEALLLPLDYSPGPLSKKRKPLEGDVQERKSKEKKKGVGGSPMKSKDMGLESDAEEEFSVRRVSFTNTTFQVGILRYIHKLEDSGESPMSKGLSKKKGKTTTRKEAHKFKFTGLESAKPMCNTEGTGISEIGSLVCKNFSGDFCNGRVVKYDEETKYYTVLYEDGEKEDLKWKELSYVLASSVAPSSKSKKSGDVQLGASLIGMEARKKLGKRFYTGSVVSYNEHTQLYMVKYKDGRREEFEWIELKPMLAAGKKLKCSANNSFENDVDNKEHHISTLENAEASSSHHRKKEREPTEADSTASFQVGDLLVGSRTLKRFGRKMYAGIVIGYNKKRKLYKIKYEDGDQEDLEWTELQPTLIQQCQQSSTDLDTDYVHKELKSGVKSKKKKHTSMKIEVQKFESTLEKAGVELKGSLVNGGETPLELGIALTGRSLMKEFSGKVYTGKVIDYDAQRKFYKVKYEDDDQEDLEWIELEPLLVAD